MASCLSGLSGVLYERSSLWHKTKDLEDAIGYQEKAVELTNQQSLDLPGWLGNLCCLYQSRYEHLGRPEDAENAVKCAAKAISVIPVGHPLMASLLNNLGDSHRVRYDIASAEEDLFKAVDSHRQAVLLTPQDHPSLPGRLSTLGESYLACYQRLGNQEDIREAIKSQQQALLLAPEGHPKRADYLTSIGISYTIQFENQGRIRDIDDAVGCFQQAMSLVPKGDAKIPNLLNSLAIAYFKRYTRLGQSEDLDRSIKSYQEAITLTPSTNISLPGLLTNLGNSYCIKFENQGRLDDINTAIDCQTRAIELLPDKHANKAGVLSRLGHSYLARSTRSDYDQDIERAVSCLSEAVDLTPEASPEKPKFIYFLVTAYKRRYGRKNDIYDIEKAAELQLQALSLTPRDHPLTILGLKKLAALYQKLFEIRKDPIFLDKSIGNYQKAAQHTVGDPRFKFTSAHTWARLATLASRSVDEQLDAYTTAMNLVPQLLLPMRSIKDQYRQIPQLGDFALGAAAVAIAAHMYDTAIEWLEQGRSIIWNQMLQLQDPLDELQAKHPTLATRIREVSNELHHSSLSSQYAPINLGHSYTLESAAQSYRRLAEEYAELIDQARELPGFENFLKPRKSNELIRAAETGPIIVVNVDQFRCDVLVIQSNSDKIVHIPLPNLSQRQLKAAREQLMLSLRYQHLQDRSRAIRFVKAKSQIKHKDKIASVLASLWYNLAKPVIDSLGYQPRPNTSASQLPRITWCTTGPLSFIPLHAAGDYAQSDARLFNCVVSSFTPTLGILLADRSWPESMSLQPTLLAIGQENTLGHTSLPGTRKELEIIRDRFNSQAFYKQLEDQDATPDSVLSNMGHYDWIHLACHAHQNIRDPVSSGFFLHGGTLSLASIAQRRLQNKGLAFLSACQTATGDEKLPDEAAHLAAGMLMAGYRSVIATMWSIMDEDAPLIANRVYAELFDSTRVNNGHWDPARALHEAIGELRGEVGDKAFFRWAPFVHLGS
ncbi:CHAT domain-containing protein [Rhizoctonia solani]|nr:CHAT domain-containing protein [Rhizoctonia solani]